MVNLRRSSFTIYLAVTVLFVLNLKHTNGLLEDVLDVIHVTKEVANGVLKAWDIVEQTNLAENIDLPITREKQKKVLRRLQELSRKIDQSEGKYVDSAAWTFENLAAYIKTNTRLELDLREMRKIRNQIRSRSKEMQRYETSRDKLEDETIIKYAEWTVSPNADSINQLLESLHSIFVGSGDTRTPDQNVLKMLSQNLEDAREQICETKQSAQQFLYSLYSDVALTELKGYTMVQFSWMMLRMYNKGNYTEESLLMRNEFAKRIESTQKLLRQVMKRADRVVWECDPTKHVKGKTYDEITRLMQGYIENEVDLNSDGTCRENCGYYTLSKNHGCYKDLYCSRQPRCTGKLYNCQYIDSDMWVCPSSLNSTRRYEYIEYESGRILGKKDTCVRGQSKVDSWWRWLFWHCSYCFCLCDEQGLKSDRYFNLRESVSDYKANMVVTGLRFVKNRRIFHIQIQQGELLPNGNIKLETLSWKPVDDYQIFDRTVKSNIDYHTMAGDKRAIDLDDIIGEDPAYVVTGVRFRVVGTHLNLEARFSEYNFETGQLIDPATFSVWKSNDNTDVSGSKRSPIILKNPDVPIRSLTKSLPTSKHNQFVEFTASDMDKDVSQSTVPFIDVQDVVSNPPVPLAGVGIYHKARYQYGGFIAPKLITYDFEPYIQSPLDIEPKQ